MRTFLDLGAAPPCERFLTAAELDEAEPTYPLHVRRCHDCLLALSEAARDIVLNNLVRYAVLSGAVKVLSDGTRWRPLAHAADIAAAFAGALAGVGPDLLPFTVDAAPGKHGRRIPGAAVPIRPVDDLRAARPVVVLVLTWDIAGATVYAR